MHKAWKWALAVGIALVWNYSPCGAAEVHRHGMSHTETAGVCADCRANVEYFGHYPTRWRRWPGESRKDELFPQAMGAEEIDRPEGRPQPELPRERLDPIVPRPHGEMVPGAGVPPADVDLPETPPEATLPPEVPSPPPPAETQPLPDRPTSEPPAIDDELMPGEPLEEPAPFEFEPVEPSQPGLPEPVDPGVGDSSGVRQPMTNPPHMELSVPTQAFSPAYQPPQRSGSGGTWGNAGIGEMANQDRVHDSRRGASQEHGQSRWIPEVQPLPWTPPAEPATASRVQPAGFQSDRPQMPLVQWSDGQRSGEREAEEPPARVIPSQPGVGGYCPVELVENEKWVPGEKRWAVEHRGRTYLMSGLEQQEKFLENPDRYAPVLSGMDPVVFIDRQSSSDGRTDFCVVYDGRLYMFSSAENLARFRQNPQRYASLARRTTY